jgi:Uma2 family endonuclease
MNPQEPSIDLPPVVVPPLGEGPQLVLRPEDYPNVDNLITEDGAPADNIFAEKQQRLLTETLYSSWEPSEGEHLFVALSNVGLFSTPDRPPLVPDCLLSLDVQLPRNLLQKSHRSYFFWVYGKMPEVVIEIISDHRGDEEDYKMSEYARMRVPYYVIHDPNNLLGGGSLRMMELHRRRYRPMADNWMEEVGLGLILWSGVYEGAEETWLRWCDREGRVLLTGRERAEQERQRAEKERQRAELADQRAEKERQRADEASERIQRLEARLRDQGLEPSA